MKNSNLVQYNASGVRSTKKPVYLSPTEKLSKKPTSRVLSVNAKCWQCMGEDADPCVKWRIGNCEIPDCALFNVRPYRRLFETKMPKGLEV